MGILLCSLVRNPVTRSKLACASAEAVHRSGHSTRCQSTAALSYSKDTSSRSFLVNSELLMGKGV